MNRKNFLLSIVFALLVVACGSTSPLVGKWTYIDETGLMSPQSIDRSSMDIRSDGKVIFGSGVIQKWEVIDGNRLAITENASDIFSIEGDILTLNPIPSVSNKFKRSSK